MVWEDEILKLYADNIPAYIGNEVINPSTENELGNVLATVIILAVGRGNEMNNFKATLVVANNSTPPLEPMARNLSPEQARKSTPEDEKARQEALYQASFERVAKVS